MIVLFLMPWWILTLVMIILKIFCVMSLSVKRGKEKISWAVFNLKVLYNTRQIVCTFFYFIQYISVTTHDIVFKHPVALIYHLFHKIY
jgi:hypothetical protein